MRFMSVRPSNQVSFFLFFLRRRRRRQNAHISLADSIPSYIGAAGRAGGGCESARHFSCNIAGTAGLIVLERVKNGQSWERALRMPTLRDLHTTLLQINKSRTQIAQKITSISPVIEKI